MYCVDAALQFGAGLREGEAVFDLEQEREDMYPFYPLDGRCHRARNTVAEYRSQRGAESLCGLAQQHRIGMPHTDIDKPDVGRVVACGAFVELVVHHPGVVVT